MAIHAEEYLKSLGIELDKTILITYIDGVIRQPDLCILLEGFKDYKSISL